MMCFTFKSSLIWSRSFLASRPAAMSKSSPFDAYMMPRDELTSSPQSSVIP